MKFQKLVVLIVVLSVHVMSLVHAQTREEAQQAELARQAAFRGGMESIVDTLNSGSMQRLMAAIDQDDMLDRIFGLRLIDPKIKRSFTEDFAASLEGMIKYGFNTPESGTQAMLLGVESRGNRGRAVVRYEEDNFTFRYHEYELRLNENGRVIVVDWIDFLSSDRFSESVGVYLVMGAPSNAAMRKLVDVRNPSERELFQFAELLKAARDRSLDRYLKIRADMPARFQNQKIVVVTTVQLARAVRQRRKMIAAVQHLASQYPDDPLYSLMLLDYYFPSRKYEEAMQALRMLAERLGFDDAAMDARYSATALVMGNPQDAIAYADLATQREPGLQLAWWSALKARAAVSDFAAAVEALQTLQSEFGFDLSPELLQQDKSYAQLLASSEYKAWRESLE